MNFEAIKKEASDIFGVGRPFPFVMNFGFTMNPPGGAPVTAIISNTIRLPYALLKMKSISSSLFLTPTGTQPQAFYGHRIAITPQGYGAWSDQFTPGFSVAPAGVIDFTGTEVIFQRGGEVYDPATGGVGSPTTYEKTPPYMFRDSGFTYDIRPTLQGLQVDPGQLLQFYCAIEWEVLG